MSDVNRKRALIEPDSVSPRLQRSSHGLTEPGSIPLTAVILAGGFGTRLRAVVSDRPKVLAEVNGRPFLAYLLDQLADAGVQSVVLCTGYKAEMIEAEFGDTYRGMSLRYSPEPEPLGTAGAIRLALPLIDTEQVLILNGDSYCDADVRSYYEEHLQRGTVGSLLLTHVEDASRFGKVLADAAGCVTDFQEKQPNSGDGWINAGLYLLSRELIAEIPPEGAVSLEREMLPGWIPRGLGTTCSKARFLDIGTPESYDEAAEFFAVDRSVAGFARIQTEQASTHARLNSCESSYDEHSPIIFLDRDGTIIQERHHLCDPDGVELLPGAAGAMRQLRSLGCRLVVVTNQSVIGRGMTDEIGLAQIHDRLRELLIVEGVELDAIYYCPHTSEDNCNCRKPATGMIDRAKLDFDFDPKQAFVIGDKPCDVHLGNAIGATSILVRTGHGREHHESPDLNADFIVDDLSQAARAIEEKLLKQPRAGIAA